jgi:hypothetical protein
MRTSTRLLASIVLTAALAAAPAASASKTTKPGKPSGPTAAQISAAVAHAKKSHDMWATVNVCNSPKYPNMLGIRGQIPSLGFVTSMYMRVQVDYWNFADSRFEPDPMATDVVSLGSGSIGLHQGGVMFQFTPPVVLSGTVTFEWKLGGKVIGKAVRYTGHGYKGVDFGDPPGYSTATCSF